MKRFFEKVSLEQFRKDYYKYLMGDGNETDKIIDDAIAETYEDIKLPRRATSGSAGYDFASTSEFVLRPNETIIIPTGIKASMYVDEVLELYVRSSIGIKFNVQLSNGTGIIDHDYFGNPSNDGHMLLAFTNHGSKDWGVGIGDKVAQGIFKNYLITGDDEPVSETRDGGVGSTGKKAK